MTNWKHGGGPVYPMFVKGGAQPFVGGMTLYTEDYHHPGMSLRDWYAGQALSGLLVNRPEDIPSQVVDGYTRLAYQLADAMLAERDKDQPSDRIGQQDDTR